MGVILAAWLAVEAAIVGWQGGPQGVLLLVCGGSAAVLILAAVPTPAPKAAPQR